MLTWHEQIPPTDLKHAIEDACYRLVVWGNQEVHFTAKWFPEFEWVSIKARILGRVGRIVIPARSIRQGTPMSLSGRIGGLVIKLFNGPEHVDRKELHAIDRQAEKWRIAEVGVPAAARSAAQIWKERDAEHVTPLPLPKTVFTELPPPEDQTVLVGLLEKVERRLAIREASMRWEGASTTVYGLGWPGGGRPAKW